MGGHGFRGSSGYVADLQSLLRFYWRERTKRSRSRTFNSASKMSTNRFNSRVGFFTSSGCALRVSSHPTSICLRMSLRRSENVPTGAAMVRNDMIGYALHFCWGLMDVWWGVLGVALWGYCGGFGGLMGVSVIY